MAIPIKEETPEQKASARAAHGELESSILDEIKDGLPADQDLSSGDERQFGKGGKRGVSQEQGEEGESEEQESEDESEQDESEDEEGSEDEGEGEAQDESEGDEESEDEAETESEDEELSPESKRKAQKRIDELTRKNKRLEGELKKMRTSAPEKTPSDPDMAKLEGMSLEELRRVSEALDDQRDEALLAGDKEKAKALRALSQKAQDALRSAPQRFQSQQINRFNAAVVSTAEALEESGRKLDAPTYQKIFDRAKKVFLGSKNLQSSPDGQAEAWAIAVEQYEEISKFSAGNNRRIEAERKVNKLKKKVSLSTATQKGNSKVSDEAKLYNRAKNGNNRDKAAFVRKAFNTDSLIPEQFRRQGQ